MTPQLPSVNLVSDESNNPGMIGGAPEPLQSIISRVFRLQLQSIILIAEDITRK
jgi:hypothetical protein